MSETQVMGGFPRPGRALKGVMIALFAIWLLFAIGMNWVGVPESTFTAFLGSTEGVLHGQIWRLFTAPLIHPPSVWAILFVLIGFYFLTPSLEESWGGPRLLRFLLGSALFAYLFQIGFQLILPQSLAQKLVPPYWYGSMPVLEAVAIAFALTFKGRTVRLWFVLPVSSRGLILFIVGISVLYLITLEVPSSGLIAPFGGMIAGWLFGGGTPSPARKAWLRIRLARLEREAVRERGQRKRRVERSGLRVIEGGERGEGGDGEGPPAKGGNGRGEGPRGPDGRLLN
jgi:membrane associated rhomboid family serine protease